MGNMINITKVLKHFNMKKKKRKIVKESHLKSNL